MSPRAACLLVLCLWACGSSAEASQTNWTGRWFEAILPGAPEPRDLHLAQLRRRLNLTSDGSAAARGPEGEGGDRRTRVAIEGDRWLVNGRTLFPGTLLEGLLPNVRMVNATFEDRRRPEFGAATNTARFLAALPDYVAHGVRGFTFNLQGGMPGYEGALNSAFGPEGALNPGYAERVRGVLEACDRAGVAVILGCFYQRQDQVLQDETAVRRAVVETVRWIQSCGFENVLLEISNEFDHAGFDHPILRRDSGQVELMRLAKQEAPGLLVSTSGLGHGRLPTEVAAAADYLLIHFNGTQEEDVAARIEVLKRYHKPIVCNEDDRTGDAALRVLRLAARAGASYGLMLKEVNQYAPFEFRGADDDRTYYEGLRVLSRSPRP